MAKPVVAPHIAGLSDWYRHNELPREAHLVMPGGPSMTRQEFADECDINTIMQRYEGHLANPMGSLREPMYYDFTEMPDTLMGLLDQLKIAEDAFNSLPATVRRDFDNDPVLFADFAANPENLAKMREYGLAPPEKVKEPPVEVRVVPEAANDKAAPAPAPAPTHVST